MREILTALILVYNERENIERTLESLSWAKRIIVLDSFSSDNTISICAGYPAVQIVQRAFDTHAKQWNFGLDQVETPWVLALDADYELSESLSQEIVRVVPGDHLAGYSAGFELRIFGKPLRASVYPPRVVLFRKDRARYVQQGHTQWLHVSGEVSPLKSAIIHDDRKPLSRWLQSQDHYMKIEASHLLATPDGQLTVQDRLRKKILFAPPIMFLYLLFVRGLIFDGWRGWYYVMQRTLAESLLSLRLLTESYKLE